MEVIAKIKKLVHDSGPLRAYGEIVLDGEFAVHGVRVIEGPNGPFAAMPSEEGKGGTSGYTGDGNPGRPAGRDRKDGKYRDICHPISAELRKAVNEAVLAAYEEACGEE